MTEPDDQAPKPTEDEGPSTDSATSEGSPSSFPPPAAPPAAGWPPAPGPGPASAGPPPGFAGPAVPPPGFAGPGPAGYPSPGGLPGGYAPPGYGSQPFPGGPVGYTAAPVGHPDATKIFVLGLAGVFCCGILGPIAWVKGNSAMREINARPHAYSNKGLVQAGRVLGMVTTGLILLGVVAAIIDFSVNGGS